MLGNYIPVVVMMVVAAVIALGMVGASAVLGPRKPTKYKQAPYECGMTPVGSARERFPIKFYLIAMLFIIFDIETIFLFPWAVSFRRLGLFGLAEMAIFIGLVFVAYAYIWRKGGFEWAHADVAPVPARRDGAVRRHPLRGLRLSLGQRGARLG